MKHHAKKRQKTSMFHEFGVLSSGSAGAQSRQRAGRCLLRSYFGRLELDPVGRPQRRRPGWTAFGGSAALLFATFHGLGRGPLGFGAARQVESSQKLAG